MGVASQDKHGGHGGGGWMWLTAKAIEKIHIAEEDPKHPEHEIHTWRTSPENPEFQDLIRAIRALGIDGLANAPPVMVYLDGTKSTVADGKRRICAIRTINADLPPVKRLEVRALIAKDPTAARNIANACRALDPPMVLARRFVEAYAVDGDKARAAAEVGLDLRTANLLEKCRALPRDIQARINRREIPPDVALRLANGGAEEARTEIAKVTDASTGKVDPKAAKAAAKKRPMRKPRAKTNGNALPHAFWMRAAKRLKDDFPAIEPFARFLGGDLSAREDMAKELIAALEATGLDMATGKLRAAESETSDGGE